jgi:hypothetical protein
MVSYLLSALELEGGTATTLTQHRGVVSSLPWQLVVDLSLWPWRQNLCFLHFAI